MDDSPLSEQLPSCSYLVDINESHTDVIVEFSEIGEDGIEVYKTGIPPEIALEFAEAVREFAQHIIDSRDET